MDISQEALFWRKVGCSLSTVLTGVSRLAHRAARPSRPQSGSAAGFVFMDGTMALTKPEPVSARDITTPRVGVYGLGLRV